MLLCRMKYLKSASKTPFTNCISPEATLMRRDVVCQRELTQVSAAWEPFEDPETRITKCVK